VKRFLTTAQRQITGAGESVEELVEHGSGERSIQTGKAPSILAAWSFRSARSQCP
jgi:hypothetical protein